jgi:hypothetical protein
MQVLRLVVVVCFPTTYYCSLNLLHLRRTLHPQQHAAGNAKADDGQAEGNVVASFKDLGGEREVGKKGVYEQNVFAS